MTDKPEAPAIPEPQRFVTEHEGTFNGRKLAYTVTASDTYLKDDEGKPRATIFSFSYVETGVQDPAKRPVTFVFNGGPGSASLWLHLGGIGPKRVVVPSEAAPAGTGPYELADNPLSILDATDLVFVDPVGTGYSRALGEATQEEFWGVDSDAESISQFITQWLTTNRRWASPRYLSGESYGTTRSVAIAAKLHSGVKGVAFNGLALLSVILDFHHAKFEKGNPFPDIANLPTYAATARYHGRIKPAPADGDGFLDEVRSFALEEYMPALLAGSRLENGRRSRVLRKLARYTGLSEAWLDRTNLRIDPSRFRKELLRDQGVVLGRFDTRYRGTDHDDAGEVPENDPASYSVVSAYVTAINDYLSRTLKVETDRPYRRSIREANEKWDWLGPKRNGVMSWPGYVNIAPELGRLQRELPDFKVWMANGRYDLATSLFGVENTIASNGIDAARVTMTYYDSGHMMYLHEPSLVQLTGDFRRFLG
ncbi:MAG TPA: peptidase S10 [Aliidongia sp.]|nr:peptidase S10 [Aliidongia sp.]